MEWEFWKWIYFLKVLPSVQDFWTMLSTWFLETTSSVWNCRGGNIKCFISFRPESCGYQVADIHLRLFSTMLMIVIVEYISKGIYQKKGVKGLIKRSCAEHWVSSANGRSEQFNSWFCFAFFLVLFFFIPKVWLLRVYQYKRFLLEIISHQSFHKIINISF